MNSKYNLCLIFVGFYSHLLLADGSYQCFKDDPNFIRDHIKFDIEINGLRGAAYPECSYDGQINCITSSRFLSVSKSQIADKVQHGQSVGGVEGDAGTRVCSSDGQTDCLTNSKFKAARTEGLASKVVKGNLVAGVAGEIVAESHSSCSSDGQVACVTSSDFAAADTSDLAAKIISGYTVTGVQGTVQPELNSYCTGPGQDSCVATNQYRTMDLTNAAANNTVALTDTNFDAQMASSSTFEFWDKDGDRHTASGSYALQPKNIVNGLTIFGVEGVSGAPLDCGSIEPQGSWLLVEGNSYYKTNDFCVMKYEAKNNGQGLPVSKADELPWTNISQSEAMEACASLGKGYRLISNHEWMTIAVEIAVQGRNWTGGSVGSGSLYKGHHDGEPAERCQADENDDNSYIEADCVGTPKIDGDNNHDLDRRTHQLKTDEFIWDLAGNVSELTSSLYRDNKFTTTNASGADYVAESSYLGNATAQTLSKFVYFVSGVLAGITDSNSAGMGRFVSGDPGTGGVVERGEIWGGGEMTGIFAARVARSESTTQKDMGFRCTVSLP